MASTYLTKDFSGASRQTWTFSCWFKRSKLNTTQTLFSSGTSNTERSSIFIEDTTSTIRYYSSEGAAVAAWTASEAVLRDPSAWYHFVCKYDTTQATATDRIKFYLNGEAMTHQTGGITAYPALNNASGYIGSNDTHGLGSLYYGSTATEYWDGSMAHVHFIDGTTYDASAFGQTDSTTGIWKPKLSPSVTYDTNGFFLKFASSGSMGTDSSGNGNNFTVGAGNLTQTQDTPSNVFATLNPLDKTGSDVSTSNGNLSATWSSNNGHLMASTLAVTKGKWYYEFKQGTGSIVVGILNLDRIGDPQGYSYCPALGTKVTSFSYTSASYGATASIGDIIGVAYDLDAGSITFYKNGTSQGTAFTSINSGTYAPFVGYAGGSTGGTASDLNFGNGYFGTTAVSSANSDGDSIGLFEYEVPSGYYALCTKNINTYG